MPFFPTINHTHQIHHYCTSRSMEPSTTNSNEIHHKTLTPPTIHDHDRVHDLSEDRERERDRDHKEPLVISCEISGSPSHQEAFLMGKMGSQPDKWLEKEVSGREKPVKVVIPERWGQEDLLKEWIDYSTFDALLAPKEAGSARRALVAEARPDV